MRMMLELLLEQRRELSYRGRMYRVNTRLPHSEGSSSEASIMTAAR